ncbi:methyltransferase domain-containing protein [Micromonospora sp. NPDC002296]|uniref:class I SAM-dependent methyltransferase n=1 Tax=Micromonospora sp. NPDC002296 TaxID=3154271 RepID=UPI00331B72FC
MNGNQQKQNLAGLFDRASETYGTHVDFFADVGRHLVEHASPKPGEHVLDVGCGRGAALFPAAEAVGPTGRVLGIDLAPGMVTLTGQEAKRRGLDSVEVRVGDAEAPEAAPGSVDLILGSLVAFLLPDIPGALRHYAKILRPGGRLSLSTFVANDRLRWMPVADTLISFMPQQPPPDPLPHTNPRSWSDWLISQMELTGYTGIDHVERQYDNVFPTPEHWWSWMESMAARAATEAIPEDRRAEAKRAVFDAVDEIRDEAGRIVWTAVMRFTTAYRR